MPPSWHTCQRIATRTNQKFLRQSILDPATIITEGFEPSMPSFVGPPLRPTTRRPPRLILNPSPSPSKMLKRATKVIDLIWSPDSPPLLEEIKKSQVKMACSRKFRPLSRETHPAASYLQRACPRVTSPQSHCSNKLGSQTS
jgi:hypothetical protein